MKNFLRFMTLNAVLAACALSASAQTQPAQPTASPDPEAAAKAACTDLYTKWRDNYKGDAAKQKIAYEAGKQFITQCPNDEYLSYVQKWVPKYEAALKGTQLTGDYAKCFQEKNWACVITSGKQIVATEPENLGVLLGIVSAGVQAGSGKGAVRTYDADALRAARQAQQLIQSGKLDAYTPQQWKDLNFPNGKAELGTWLNSNIAFLTLQTSPAEAANIIVKTLQSDENYKKDARAYYQLFLAYQNGEYVPQAKDYQDNCAGKDLTDECKVKVDRLNLVVDRMIDALARAVSYSSDAALKAEYMKQLEGFYKFRNNDQTTGLDALIAGIQAKPLLLASAQTMPTPAPAPAPATNTTPSGAAVSNPGATTTPATPTPTPAPANTAKPTPSTNTPTTAKPANGTTAKPKP